MKNLTRFLCLALGGLLSASLAAQAAAPRQRQLLDSGWRFQRAAPDTLAQTSAVTAWRFRAGLPSEAALVTPVDLDTSGGDWKDAAIGQDTFGGRSGYAWYRASLPALKASGRVLHFESVDDNATVYLNGVKLIHHEGWNDPFDVPLDSAWHAQGNNAVSVLVDNPSGAGGIMGAVTLGTLPTGTNADPISPAYNDRAWRTVHLPHDYVVEGTFDPSGDAAHASLPTPRAWYRKTFMLPTADKNKAVWIDFDGVYRDSKVYLNGTLLGEHPGGYDGFRYDISRAAHFGGANVLAVSVDPAHHEGWWYEGGGIYRHVWLNVASPVHIAPWGTFVTTKMPEPGADGKAASAMLTVKSAFVNTAGSPASCRVAYHVFDPKGQEVTAVLVPHPLSVSGSGQNEIVQQLFVPSPHLWSLETPQLYRVRTEIRQNGKTVDTTDTPFGIRTIRFDAQQGFFLNGKHIEIKGTCNHQDFAGVGIGMPDSLLYWRVKKLKEMGSNAYRMSHNPPTAELLDACDKLGMLVMDENRHLGDTEASKSSLTTPYSDLSELRNMILRDRNHPSIIMWSLCNEEGIQGSPQAATIFTAMMKVVSANDGTRPITCAMNGGYDSADGITSVEDLQGINYNPGNYDGFHQAHPNMPLYGSETSSEVGTRGVYDQTVFKSGGGSYRGDETKGFISAYDNTPVPWGQSVEDAWKAIADRPFMAGGYVWTGFDYKGEPTPFVWPDINSNFGAMDECGFPKDAYYYYQSAWGDTPMVHVLPHWNWAGQEGKPVDVWAYSTADSVELFLNGKSFGVQPVPKNGHAHWSVPYAPGTLEARGLSGGSVTATDKVETTGPPAALKLTTDRAKLTADGEDVTMVEVDVVDAEGRIVPTASNPVTFTLAGAGRIAGVGNGDPSSHEPDQAPQRSAFNGKCLAIIGAGDTPGQATLSAQSPGLKSAALGVSVLPSDRTRE